MTGQPPEVDPEDNTGQLPPPENAAQRVLEFVAWFGDGVVAGGDEPPWGHAPPLYARDLEAVALAAQKPAHPPLESEIPATNNPKGTP